MSQSSKSIILRLLGRWAILSVGLAIAVTGVLLGILRIRRDLPEWVYWKSELIFLITIEIAYGTAACLCLLGVIVLGTYFLRARGRGQRRPWIARGLLLCIALLGGLALAEATCAGWISWSRRFTVVPVGGLEAREPFQVSTRFAKPTKEISLRTDFPDPPGDRDIDLVVLGESSAEGVPYQRWVSIGKIVAWKLQQVIPDRPIRLHVLALSGDTLERQHLTLSNLNRRPDLLVIYCGHNEFYSRLWWSRNLDHYVVDQRPSRFRLMIDKLERYSSVCTLIREIADKCRIAIPPPADTSRNLVDTPVYTAEEYRLLLADFRNRLDEIVSYAERVGALPILILPPANDADFEPNRSYLPPMTPRAERDAFERRFLAIRQLEAVDSAAARQAYRALLARQPCFAEAHYRLAELLEQSGEWEEAYRQYIEARDLDGMPMRCPSSFQQAYRDVASRHGCILIDGQSYFHAIGRHGLLDDELFQDAMHPSLRGQIALAQAVLVALQKRHAFGWSAESPIPVIDPSQVASHFGIDKSAWRTIAMWWKGFNELVTPLRYDRNMRSRKRAAAIAAVDQLDAGIAPETVGLPNVGTPVGIPVIDHLPEASSEFASPILPCLTE
jgi:tetratricopeptide (TPR) repeat protein